MALLPWRPPFDVTPMHAVRHRKHARSGGVLDALLRRMIRVCLIRQWVEGSMHALQYGEVGSRAYAYPR